MSSEGRVIGRMFEIVNFTVSQIVYLLQSDLVDNPLTIYKYYSYGMPTYNVFLCFLDSIIILIGLVVITYLFVNFCGKKIGR